MSSANISSEDVQSHELQAIDALPLLAIVTVLAVPLTPSSWRRASENGRSNVGKLCDISTIISAFLIIYAWKTYPAQESYRAIDPAMMASLDEKRDSVTAASLGHFGLATIISGTAFCLELFHVIAHMIVVPSTRSPEQKVPEPEPEDIRILSPISDVTSERRKSGHKFCLWTLSSFHDSECILIVYTILLSVYGLMFFSSGRYNVVFADPFVTNYHRPMNAVRFIEWAVASPILMTLTGRSIPRICSSNLSDPQGEFLSNLVRPGLVTTSMYMWLTFQAQVVLDFKWRVILIAVGFMCYILASADQCTAWLRDRDMSAPTAKAAVYLLYFQVIFFGLYGAVFLLGSCGMINPILEQKIFTMWDVTIKVAFSAALMSMRSASLLEETRKAKFQYATAAFDLSRLVDTANAPIFAVDLDLRVTLWNKKIAELTGRSSKKVIGMLISDFLSPECREAAMDVLGQCNNDNPTTGQFHCDFLSAGSDSGNNNSNPQKISCIMTGSIRHNANNDFVGIVGVGQDLTEVTHYRDVEVKKQRLMAMVSHEIKSPLHGIIGLTGSLCDTESNQQRCQQLKMVKSCATRLLDLVSNIMDMSVLQQDSDGRGGSQMGVAEKKPCARDPVEISAIIAEVCTLVRNAVDKSNKPLLHANVELINQVRSNSLPIVTGDAYKITQVFYNIVTNACKFCTAGRIIVSAGINPAKDKLNVCVEDTGVGISEESIKRIFEPFEQEHPTEQRSFSGIGLGLAIAREVMRKHGGDIYVRSVLGEGSAFTICFPIKPENVKASPVPGRPEDNDNKYVGTTAPNWPKSHAGNNQKGADPNLRAATKRKMDRFSKPVILSVDDDLVNQEVIKSALSANYEIHTAMDGFEALRYFERRAKLPDLVLLDVMMPGMTGFEVLDWIRKNSGISPAVLPVIMLSATEPVGKAIIQSLDSGSNDYVSKPFDVSILRARVHTAVQIKRLHEVELEMTQFSQLLNEIMPRHIVQRLISGEKVISERHDSVCILFSDIVGWTTLSEELPTAQLIGLLNSLFSKFDVLTEKHNVYKVDTIGDGYIVACGHDSSNNQYDHTHRVVDFALAIIEAAKSISMPSGLQLQLRVGIHTGPAYTGIVGNKVPKYTFFGDTINTCSRMESTGVSGCIQISTAARQALEMERCHESNSQTPEEWLKGKGATLVERGNIEVKNKGMMKTHIIFPRGVTPNMTALRRGSSQSPSSIDSISSEVTTIDAELESATKEMAKKRIAEAEQKACEANKKAKATLEEKQKMEVKLLGELDSLQFEFQKIHSSEMESREECERLRVVLAETQARLHSSSIGSAPSIMVGANGNQPRRTSFRLPSGIEKRGRIPSFESFGSFMADEGDDDNERALQTSDECEKLRLQLLVTTKALNRARSHLLEKEEEIDMKELELQQLIVSINSQQTSGQVASNYSTSDISSLKSVRRKSFSQHTRRLLMQRSNIN